MGLLPTSFLCGLVPDRAQVQLWGPGRGHDSWGSQRSAYSGWLQQGPLLNGPLTLVSLHTTGPSVQVL